MTKHNWYLNEVHVKVGNTTVTGVLSNGKGRRKDKEPACKGKGKGAKIARCQSITDAMPETFMKIAAKANRAERQRVERKAMREAKREEKRKAKF